MRKQIAGAPPRLAHEAPLDEAIERGVTALRAAQDADGAWRSAPDMGPLAIALVALTEFWFGALSGPDAKRCAEALKRAQRADGGFDLHPYARSSTLGATAVCRAALKACGVADTAPFVERVTLMWHGHFATSHTKVETPVSQVASHAATSTPAS